MEGVIKLTGEKDLFYDSNIKQYRLRIYCSNCGKVSGCRCFDTLENIEYNLFPINMYLKESGDKI